MTSRDVEGTQARVRVRHLHVVMAPREAHVTMMPLLGEHVVIGRDAEGPMTLGLPDDECSRQHARLEHDRATDLWRIVDLGSRNGTFVGGVRTGAAELTHGTVVRVGSSLLVFSETELSQDQPLVTARPGLLGRSFAMQRVRGEIEMLGPRSLGVMILGETGVGKERVAEGLHVASRRSGAFVPVNCAAIPAETAESELFGHVAGAFTGAVGRSDGLFIAADRGTLFLDEIGELAAPLQAKLLRAIATGEVRPVGTAEVRPVDVRILAATHVDLEAAIAAGGFRGDLWARLASAVIAIPPLRARREDILDLALASLPEGTRLSPSGAEALLLHDWPFNVRELQSAMATASLRPSDGVVRLEHLADPIAARVADRGRGRATNARPPLATLVDRTRVPGRAELETVLRHFDGSVALTAEFFGKDRRQIYRWLEKHALDPEALRGPAE